MTNVRCAAGMCAMGAVCVAAPIFGQDGGKMDAAADAKRSAILVMSDGLRWQEVFTGADERYLNKDNGVKHEKEIREQFWRETPEERREALMPFLWSTVAKEGQIFGNRAKGSDAHITNPHKVSYPGYSEAFCGFPNEYIDGNKRIPNPEETVFEWIHRQDGYSGRIAAFGAWELFPFIFNTERCGFPVDAGMSDVTFGTLTDNIRAVNRIRAETPYRWSGAAFDSFVFRPALEWMTVNRPRVMFIGLGETDEWAHEGEYEQYLLAAHRADDYLRELWATLQSMPEYRGTTSIIFTCDHGRGGGGGGVPDAPGVDPRQWRDHNSKVVGAEEIWIAIIGPDTPALGERTNVAPVTQSQIAGTMAALLGMNYNAAQPKAALPIAEAIATRSGTR